MAHRPAGLLPFNGRRTIPSSSSSQWLPTWSYPDHQTLDRFLGRSVRRGDWWTIGAVCYSKNWFVLEVDSSFPFLESTASVVGMLIAFRFCLPAW